MLIALVSVPFMLLPKPLILKKRHEKRAAQLEAYGRVSPTDADADDEESNALHIAAPHGGHDEEEFDFSEVMVHQASTLPARFLGSGPCLCGISTCVVSTMCSFNAIAGILLRSVPVLHFSFCGACCKMQFCFEVSKPGLDVWKVSYAVVHADGWHGLVHAGRSVQHC